MSSLLYRTRDGDGKDIVKEIELKEFPVVEKDFVCPICHRHQTRGSEMKKIVSSNFTDWEYFDGDTVCADCSKLFSLYFYSYSVENGNIKVFNVREIRENILRTHETPFKFIITKSKKKHLFYRAYENLSDETFAIQLENETIFTNRERMIMLFDFVECLITLGQSKTQMAEGNLNYDILSQEWGFKAFDFLQSELAKSREIQIPIFCGQKREISEEDALCTITSILTT